MVVQIVFFMFELEKSIYLSKMQYVHATELYNTHTWVSSFE